jgi:hypothetical protein
MKNPLQALLGAGLLPKTDFDSESRYHGSEVRTLPGPKGEPVAYLARRFPPSPDLYTTASVATIAGADRLDRISARLLGNAERFWQLADVNGALWPTDLEAEGAKVRTTLPAGVKPSEDAS